MKRVMSLLAALALAACGSTVATTTQRAATGGSGLSSGPLSSSTVGGGSTVATTPGATPPSAGQAIATPATAPVDSGGTEAPAVVSSGTESSTVSGPIELGFVTTAVSNASAFGASLGTSLTDLQIDKALVDAFNRTGGIDGRKITAVYARSDTADASWDADFAAACASFTQDNHVAAVLGYVFDHIDAFESCLAAKGVPHLSTTFNVPDATGLAQYPLLVELSTPTVERRSIAKIDAGLAMGILTPASKIGILLDSCVSTQRAWNDKVAPYIASKGLHVAATFAISCADGATAADSAAAQIPSLLLHFRAAQVNTVMFDSVSEGPALLLISEAAEAQGWRPNYIVSSLAQTSILGPQMPAAQAANVYGVGWMPVSDVIPSQWPPTTPSVSRCIAMLRSEGITLSAPGDYGNAFSTCDAMFLYETALRATGGNSNGTAVVRAVEALGTSYDSVEDLGGAAMFGPGDHDAPVSARTFGWSAQCKCFSYRSTQVPMP